MPLPRSPLITVTIASVIFFGALAFSLLVIVPRLSEVRSQFDADRAAETVIQQQRSNLQGLTADLGTIHSQQQTLDQDLWSFATEDSFFTWTDQLGAADHVTLSQVTLADATPGPMTVTRAITLVVTGPASDVLASIAALQQHQPLVAIREIDLATGIDTGTLQATIQATSLWK